MTGGAETDILVIGSGAGALTAALTASLEGAQALVIEKSSHFGGTSASSGGAVWIPNSDTARAQGHADDPREARAYLDGLIGTDVPSDRIDAYVEHARAMLAYMEARTEVAYTPCPYPDYRMDLPGARVGYRTHDPVPLMANRLGRYFADLEPPHPLVLTLGRFGWTLAEAKLMATMSPGAAPMLAKLMMRYALDWPWRLRTKRSRRLTGGNALLGRLRISLDQQDVPLWLNAPMTALLSEGGRIVGAQLMRDGRPVTVRARSGVILASGGFDHDEALRTQHLPQPGGGWSAGVRSNMGDGLRAGISAGAAVAALGSGWRAPVLLIPGEERARPLFMERALPYSIVVDQSGRRYMNEAASYHDAGDEMYRLNRPGAQTIPSWLIFDVRYRSKYMLGLMLPSPAAMDCFIPRAMRAILRKAPSIEALAGQIDVPAHNLLETIARFNVMARAGRDEDFGRGESAYDRHYADLSVTPNPTMGPLEQGPFYAVPIYPGDLGTNGGLVTDARARVLRADGSIIEGLYATGNVAASAMGRAYPGAGATLGPAMTFGWLAALDACGRAPADARCRQHVVTPA